MHFSDTFIKRFLHFLPDAMLVLNGLIHWHIFNKVLVGKAYQKLSNQGSMSRK